MTALAFASVGLAFAAIRSATPELADAEAAAHGNDPPTEESADGNYVPIVGEITAGDARLSFHGALEYVPDLTGLDLDFVFEGRDPTELAATLGISLINLPPYHIEGHLRRGQVWNFNGVTGTIGDTRFRGEASVDFRGEQPYVRADVFSPEAYWKEVKPLFLDLTETEQRPRAARRNLLSVDRFDTELMHKLDAQVSFRGKRIESRRVVLTDVTGQIKMSGGVLTYDATGFVAAGGKVASHGRVDIRRQTARSSFAATIRQINLHKVLERFDFPVVDPGIVGGHFDLSGSGRSLAEFFNTVSGKLSVILAGGRIETIKVDVLERDVLELLKALGAGEAGGKILCAVGDFRARNGIVTIETLVVEIADAVITGTGTIDFRDERLDLTLTPHPKEPGWWSLAGIAHVTGSFRNPEVSVDLFEDIGPASRAVEVGSDLKPLTGLLDYIDPASAAAPACRRLLRPGAQPGQ